MTEPVLFVLADADGDHAGGHDAGHDAPLPLVATTADPVDVTATEFLGIGESLWVVVPLLALLCCTALAIIRMRSLFAAVMLTGIFSFLGASWMLLLDAPDVAFTEAAVGAGISTIVMLSTLGLTTRNAKQPSGSQVWPLAIVLFTAAALVYATLDMPHYGDPAAPVHVYPSPNYVERAEHEIHIPNVVTAVLASYRGYDTLGEVVVIFTAGLGVMLLLRNVSAPLAALRRLRPDDEEAVDL